MSSAGAVLALAWSCEGRVRGSTFERKSSCSPAGLKGEFTRLEVGSWWSASDVELSNVRKGTGQARLHTTTAMARRKKGKGIDSQRSEQEHKRRPAIIARQRTKRRVSRARRVDCGEDWEWEEGLKLKLKAPTR